MCRQFRDISRAMKTICVYKGYGMHEQDTDLLHRVLNKYVCQSEYQVTCVSPEEILKDKLKADVDLLVIGGGFDLGLIKVLGQPGMTKIREYVHDGGSYLGICSGAYFACDYIQFDYGGPLQVVGERFLKFYSGSCVGPLYKPYDYKSKSGAVAALIDYRDLDAKKTLVPKNGCLRECTESRSLKSQQLSDDTKFDVKEIKREEDSMNKKISCGNYVVESRGNNKLIKTSTNGFQTDIFVNLTSKENDDKDTKKCQIKSQSEKRIKKDIASSPNQFKVFFNGGGYFINNNMQSFLNGRSTHKTVSQADDSDEHPCKKRKYDNDEKNGIFDNVSILSNYLDLPDTPAAILKCKFGKGFAVLSGVHFEYDADDFEEMDEHVKDIIPELHDSSQAREKMFKSILHQLNIQTNSVKIEKL